MYRVTSEESFFLTGVALAGELALALALAGELAVFPPLETTSPNKLTAALTDWNGALVSTSPTSALGEPEPEPFC